MTQLTTYRLAFIGFGTVAKGAIGYFLDRADLLRTKYQIEVKVVAIYTARRGSLYQPDGLDLATLLKIAGGSLLDYPDSPHLQRGLDSRAIITDSNANVIVEVSPTNFVDAQPALDSCRLALQTGKHIITANKGPLALAFRELNSLAEQKGLYFGYEGTVMGGTPVLQFTRVTLAGMTITGVRGIINSTTNYILTEMEAGKGYAEALKDAQRLGFAEADPSGDVDGHDAAGKLTILANVVLGADFKPAEVQRVGISQLTIDDIEAARRSGQRWKLIASAERQAGGTIHAQVRPERLPLSDPLAGVAGVTAALTFQTDLLGPVTIVGAGAGLETGIAILSDLIDMHRTRPNHA